MGKKTKKKAAKKSSHRDGEEEPAYYVPYVTEKGVRFSGLETEGMKNSLFAKSSLLLPRREDDANRVVDARYIDLPAMRLPYYPEVLVNNSYDRSNRRMIDFPGAKPLQITVCYGDWQEQEVMPENMMVVGRCRFTTDCYEQFKVLMRSREESKAWNMPSNGILDWPNVRALQLCPLCSTTAQPSSESTTTTGDQQQQQQQQQKEYWFLFYPLYQLSLDIEKLEAKGMHRMCYRLMCKQCLRSLVNHQAPLFYDDETTVVIPFEDYQSNPVLRDKRLLKSFSDGDGLAAVVPTAWELYCIWEESGCWTAAEYWFSRRFHMTTNFDPAFTIVAPDSDGAVCLACGKMSPKDKIKRCSRCKDATYCNVDCQRYHWEKHKMICCAPPSSSKTTT